MSASTGKILIQQTITPKLLASSCSTMPVRHLASLLLEFSFPGQRRHELLLDTEEEVRQKLTKDVNHIPPKKKFRNMGPDKFLEVPVRQARYASETFKHYVLAAREVDGNQDIPLPGDTDFYQSGVSAELKIANVIWRWIHKGVEGAWLGNNRKLRTTTAWVKADDAARQAAFLDTERCLQNQDPLAKLLLKALGEDYPARKRIMLKELEFICRVSRVYKRGKLKAGGALTKEEADYVDELLLSPPGGN